MQRNLNRKCTQQLLRLVSFSLLALLAASCSLPGKPKENPVKTYMLRWDAPMRAAEKPSDHKCLTVLINTPRAAPGFASARMVYIEKPYRLDYFATHAWVDAPARMMAPLIRRDLEKSGLFDKVILNPAESTEYGLRIEFELLSLLQDFSGGKNEEQISLHMDVYDATLHQLVISRTFSLAETAKGRTPYAGVIAANQMMPRLMTEVTQYLERNIPKNLGACGESTQ